MHTVHVWNELRAIYVSHSPNPSSCITCLAKVDFFSGNREKNSNTLDTLPFDLKKIHDQIITDETLSHSRNSLHPLPFEEPKRFVICWKCDGRRQRRRWQHHSLLIWTVLTSTSQYNEFHFLLLPFSGQNPSYPRWSWIRKRIASKSKYLTWIAANQNAWKSVENSKKNTPS